MKDGLGPLASGAGPKGFLEVRGRRPASGESLVRLSDAPDPIEHVAGDARFVGDRYTSRVNAEANHHDDDPNLIWTGQSNVVPADELPNRGTRDFSGIPVGPTIGQPDAANPLGRKQPASLEE